MLWKRIGLLAAAGALLAAGGCDASVTGSASPAAGTAQAGEAVPSDEGTVSSDTAEAAGTDDPASELRSGDPAETTVSVVGTITEIDREEHLVTIGQQGSSEPQDAVAALVTDDTLIVDCVTGRSAAEADLRTGQLVSAALSQRMTRSIPPQSPAFALIVNIPESGLGAASYVRVLDVMQAENGSTIVLNQNADLYVTIPAELPIERLGSSEPASPDDIHVGSQLIAWYDVVAESYPAQTTATRVVLAD